MLVARRAVGAGMKQPVRPKATILDFSPNWRAAVITRGVKRRFILIVSARQRSEKE